MDIEMGKPSNQMDFHPCWITFGYLSFNIWSFASPLMHCIPVAHQVWWNRHFAGSIPKIFFFLLVETHSTIIISFNSWFIFILCWQAGCEGWYPCPVDWWRYRAARTRWQLLRVSRGADNGHNLLILHSNPWIQPGTPWLTSPWTGFSMLIPSKF